MKLMTLEPDPSYGGGSEALSLALSRELARCGHSVHLVCEREGSMLPSYREFAAGIFRVGLPGFSRRAPASTIACAWRIGSLARKIGIDVVLCSHLGFLPIAALVRSLFDVRFCFHLGLPNAGSSGFQRMIYRRINVGVAPSEHTRASWIRAGWPARSIVTIPNWVDATTFCPAKNRTQVREQLGMSKEGPSIVFVGRICREKGVGILVEAFSLVHAVLEAVELFLVGHSDPGYRAHFDGLINSLEPECRRRITLRSVTHNPETYLAAADLVCVPSCWEEPFGLTLIEAMACGRPVVATRVGAFPKILGDDNDDLLVEPNDAAALADRIIWWLQHSKEAGVRGMELRRRAIECFAPANSVSRYESLIAELRQ
jgi:glycosyltransferase involved in cell wall biosynthesis